MIAALGGNRAGSIDRRDLMERLTANYTRLEISALSDTSGELPDSLGHVGADERAGIAAWLRQGMPERREGPVPADGKPARHEARPTEVVERDGMPGATGTEIAATAASPQQQQPAAKDRDAATGPDGQLRDRVLQLALALTERVAPTKGVHGRDMNRRIREALCLPSSGAVAENDVVRLAARIAHRRAEADIRVELVRSMSASPLHESAARYHGEVGSHRSDHRKRWGEELPKRLAGLGRDGVTPSELEREVACVALAARGTPYERLAGAMADALGLGTVNAADDLRRERGEVLRALGEPLDRQKPLARLTLARRLHQTFTGSEILALAESRARSAVPEADRERVAAGVRLLLATRIEEPAPWRGLHEQLGRNSGAVPTREAGIIIEPF